MLEEDTGAALAQVGEAVLVPTLERARQVVGDLGPEGGCDRVQVAVDAALGERAPEAGRGIVELDDRPHRVDGDRVERR